MANPRYLSRGTQRGGRGDRGRGRARGRGGGQGGQTRNITHPTYTEDLEIFNRLSSPSFATPHGGRGVHSGFSNGSSPRGYPPRNLSVAKYKVRHGGLGFPSSNSMMSQSQPSTSQLSRQQSHRLGASDSRLLIPIKFVKATALTQNFQIQPDAHLPTNPTDPQSGGTISVNSSNKTARTSFVDNQHAIPLDPVSPTMHQRSAIINCDPLEEFSAQYELEDVTNEAAAYWQSKFPGSVTIDFGRSNSDSSLLKISTPAVPTLQRAASSSVIPDVIDLTKDVDEMVIDLTSADSIISNKAISELNNDESRATLSTAPTIDAMPAFATANLLIHSVETGTIFSTSQSTFNIVEPQIMNLDPSPSCVSIKLPNQLPVSSQNTVSLEQQEQQFYVDSVGDYRNVESILAELTKPRDTNPQPQFALPNYDEDSEDDEVILFQPLSARLVPREADQTSHLSRIISDPVFGQSSLIEQGFTTEPSVSKPSNPWPATHPKPSKKAQKAAARQKKAERKRNSRKLMNRGPARNPKSLDSDQMMHIREEKGDSQSDIDWGDDRQSSPTGKSNDHQRPTGKRAWKRKEDLEILADYMKNTAMSVGDSEEENESENRVDSKEATTKGDDRYLSSFLNSMWAGARQQQTIDELDAIRQEEIDDEELDRGGWKTETSSSSDDESPEAPRFIEEVGASNGLLGLPSRASTSKVNSMEPVAGKPGLGSKDEPQVIGDAEDSEVASNSSSESDLNMALAEHQHIISESSDPDFESELMPSESDFEYEQLKKGFWAKTPKAKGKMNSDRTRTNPMDPPDEELIEFIEELQNQWKNDRKKKSKRKHEKMMARLEREPKNKKESSKRNKKLENTNRSKFGGFDGGDQEIQKLNEQIKEFIQFRPDLCSFALPPLTKKLRARFHLVASIYGLKSHSQGQGNSRHIILERTHRTTLMNVSERKIERTLYGRDRNPNEERTKNDRRLRGEQCGGEMIRFEKAREGTLVGDGANHLSEDNVGFKLLAKMGWSMGQGIGAFKAGLQQPLMAVVKNTKGGLGMTQKKNNKSLF